MTVVLTLPIQTTKGIVDQAQWFQLSMCLHALARGLLQARWQLGDRFPGNCGNCYTHAAAYRRVLGERFGLTQQSGYFGTMTARADGSVIQCEHSWLTADCAPEWVIDVVPFNGFPAPLIVQGGLPPWGGLYRPVPNMVLPQNAADDSMQEFLVAVLEQYLVRYDRQLE